MEYSAKADMPLKTISASGFLSGLNSCIIGFRKNGRISSHITFLSFLAKKRLDLPFIFKKGIPKASISSKHLVIDILDTSNFSAARTADTSCQFSYKAFSNIFCVKNEITEQFFGVLCSLFFKSIPINGR